MIDLAVKLLGALVIIAITAWFITWIARPGRGIAQSPVDQAIAAAFNTFVDRDEPDWASYETAVSAALHDEPAPPRRPEPRDELDVRQFVDNRDFTGAAYAMRDIYYRQPNRAFHAFAGLDEQDSRRLRAAIAGLVGAGDALVRAIDTAVINAWDCRPPVLSSSDDHQFLDEAIYRGMALRVAGCRTTPADDPGLQFYDPQIPKGGGFR